jgi:uncharacterized membrane protein YraQ (UPF0718 family)
VDKPSFDTAPFEETVKYWVAKSIVDFTSILYEALPFIILGAVIAGILEELLPQKLVARVLPRSRTLAIAMGGLLGLIFPMCECGIIPVMRRLLRKGLPLSCCVAYILAGPVINIVVLLSTYVAFSKTRLGPPDYQMNSLWMSGLRAGLAYLVAFGTALIVERQYQRYGTKLLMPLAIPPSHTPLGDDDPDAPGRTVGQRLAAISETALHDFIDITVFLILGAFLSAIVRLMLSTETIAQLSSGHAVLSILVMMGLAVVLCLCSEADAFVAASFTTLRPAAKLAFLVLGPMLDFKLYMMYTRVFRPRLIYTIFVSVIVQVFVYSYATHLLWERYAPQIAPAPSSASK